MRKRIWVLSELYYPEQSATGYFVTHVAEGLAGHFPVKVLCGQPSYLARGTRAPSTEIRNNVDIRRCAGTTFNKDILFFRLINMITLSGSILLRAVLSLRRGDLVMAVTNPPSLPFLAAMACRLRGATFVLRIEDVYPEAMIAAGLVRPGTVWIRLLDRLHGKLYAYARNVIVLGRDMRDLVEHKLPEGIRNTVFIPNWADIEEIVPLPRTNSEFLSSLGIQEKFVVQYSGNMGRTHDVESIVECARLLQETDRIHFLFIGWGAKEAWLRRTVKEQGLTNVTVLPPQPREVLCRSLNACDVAIITFVRGMSGVSVPSRMYNNLAAGKPIIAAADDSSELARLVREEQVGWVVGPDSPELLAKVICEAAASPDVVAGMAARARTVVERSYSQRSVIEGYVELFRRLEQDEPGSTSRGPAMGSGGRL